MIRLAIIGTGGMANSHAWCFNKIRGCKLVACCDVVPGRAAEFAAKHGIPSAYMSVEEMLDAESLDAVSIVTPDNVHAECALLAIKHGLHVLCEKPLADNLKDAKRMAEAARRKKVLTTVNFSYRNASATQKAARMLLGTSPRSSAIWRPSRKTRSASGSTSSTPMTAWRRPFGSKTALSGLFIPAVGLQDT